MNNHLPVMNTIMKRKSDRSFTTEPIDGAKLESLKNLTGNLPAAPFGSAPRFKLIVSKDEDKTSLKKLGTYGVFKNPAAFLIMAAGSSKENLVDSGYSMEHLLLKTTDLGLGSCWVGGSFNKGNFSEKIGLKRGEILPAIAVLGNKAPKKTGIDNLLGTLAASGKRKEASKLFFEKDFTTPLLPEKTGFYSIPLEMVRLAPSADNAQPWRIIKEAGRNIYHFYLHRSKKSTTLGKLLGFADLQMMDIGIALCHFETTAVRMDLKGKWLEKEPGKTGAGKSEQYIISWIGE